PAVAAAAGAGRPADRRTAAALPRRWRAAPAAGRRDRTGRLPVAGVVRAAGRRPAGRTGGHRPQRRQASARPAVLAVQRRRCAGPARSVRRRRQHAGARAASDHRGRNRRTDGLHRAYQRDLPAAAQYAGLVPDGAVHAGAGDLAGAGGRDRAVDRDLAEAATAMAQACTAANGRCRVAVMFSGDGGPSLQTPAAMKPYLSIALVAAFAIGAPPARAQPRPPPASQTLAVPGWTGALQSSLEAVDARHRGDIGVYVRHLDRDESFSHRADEPWYLASGIKVPVAIAVLRAVAAGALSLDTRVTLLASDYVDGAGGTNAFGPGTRLRVSWLLEQMIVHSDNTASDVLIRSVGIDQVKAVAMELTGVRDLRITTLADVRRLAYGQL